MGLATRKLIRTILALWILSCWTIPLVSSDQYHRNKATPTRAPTLFPQDKNINSYSFDIPNHHEESGRSEQRSQPSVDQQNYLPEQIDVLLKSEAIPSSKSSPVHSRTSSTTRSSLFNIDLKRFSVLTKEAVELFGNIFGEDITNDPTVEPSAEPSVEPTTEPTFEYLTIRPTVKPTFASTLVPTIEVSQEPTQERTEWPTVEPTLFTFDDDGGFNSSSTAPSFQPTFEPSIEGFTVIPSEEPTIPPSVSSAPVYVPPTNVVTNETTQSPTVYISEEPTMFHNDDDNSFTRFPTQQFSNVSVEPTIEPSIEPSMEEYTRSPSIMLTEFPTQLVSDDDMVHSHYPTLVPSIEVSTQPSYNLSSIYPSEQPTEAANDDELFTRFPTIMPSMVTVEPSLEPSAELSLFPSMEPTVEFSVSPSEEPSLGPTIAPSVYSPVFVPPTIIITNETTVSPTRATTYLSEEPTLFYGDDDGEYSRSPTTNGTVEPSMEPSFEPSMDSWTHLPSRMPTSEDMFPTLEPTESVNDDDVGGTKYPTFVPTVYVPTSQPSWNVSSIYPSEQPTELPNDDEVSTLYPTVTPSMVTIEPTFEPSMDMNSISPSEEPTVVPTVPPSFNAPVYVPPTIVITNETTRSPTRVTTYLSEEPTLFHGDDDGEYSRSPTTSGNGTVEPTMEPSFEPSMDSWTHLPSRAPTSNESFPTLEPTESVNDDDVGSTKYPTFVPTVYVPTADPTWNMSSIYPSEQPTELPNDDEVSTRFPTIMPSFEPSADISTLPSMEPTVEFSVPPSEEPSLVPTIAPSVYSPVYLPPTIVILTTSPTLGSKSEVPTIAPTDDYGVKDTIWPSLNPTPPPTALTLEPTLQPSFEPSVEGLTQYPTHFPSEGTMEPSVEPSVEPSHESLNSFPPSFQPVINSFSPSESPSIMPSFKATKSPTERPSVSMSPSYKPSTNVPTLDPTMQPLSYEPTSTVSEYPTEEPTVDVSIVSTAQPSHEDEVTIFPTEEPTLGMSHAPSQLPSYSSPIYVPPTVVVNPTLSPVMVFSEQPTIFHSEDDDGFTRYPTVNSSHISTEPTFEPSFEPSVEDVTSIPSMSPSILYTLEPTLESDDDSSESTKYPTLSPFGNSSVAPSMQPSYENEISTFPTEEPTEISSMPTQHPSYPSPVYVPPTVIISPTEKPTTSFSEQPTMMKSDDDEGFPTFRPTNLNGSSVEPTMEPSFEPSVEALTHVPTFFPSMYYTQEPTLQVNDDDLVSTKYPTLSPAANMSILPTMQPSYDVDLSIAPTDEPTLTTSNFPTQQPLFVPPTIFWNPTRSPTMYLSEEPTIFHSDDDFSHYPTRNSTNEPTMEPSFEPSDEDHPSFQPTIFPSALFTEEPTVLINDDDNQGGTKYPTLTPSGHVTVVPTVHPTHEDEMSVSPTEEPTMVASNIPSHQPSFASPIYLPPTIVIINDTHRPSSRPTLALPTEQPTEGNNDDDEFLSHVPTLFPTVLTSEPTLDPTEFSLMPSMEPSVTSLSPSEVPSFAPTVSPTILAPIYLPPTIVITNDTNSPTMNPTFHDVQSIAPSEYPTHESSFEPTVRVTDEISHNPTIVPSMVLIEPTFAPTEYESTSQPSMEDTLEETVHPTMVVSNSSVSPTEEPSEYPSEVPTFFPTQTIDESSEPTIAPSQYPSEEPSIAPTINAVTRSPTDRQSNDPTFEPSILPSTMFSVSPTEEPSEFPTDEPSATPTRNDFSQSPSVFPSLMPAPTSVTYLPSREPSKVPSIVVSTQPTMSLSEQPSEESTVYPTWQPSEEGSAAPTFEMSSFPSETPSIVPTEESTFFPSIPTSTTTEPTFEPSVETTVETSSFPTLVPSLIPTIDPSMEPTAQALEEPTVNPTVRPTIYPTFEPSISPNSAPMSGQPTIFDTLGPTEEPTKVMNDDDDAVSPTVAPTEVQDEPTQEPSVAPTREVISNQPSIFPTKEISFEPTAVQDDDNVEGSPTPTVQPSFVAHSISPSVEPTMDPTFDPSSGTTEPPTTVPSFLDTRKPTRQLTDSPTEEPTTEPTVELTTVPSSVGSVKPTQNPATEDSLQPTMDLTQIPTYNPVHIPSIVPSGEPTVAPSVLFSQQPTSALTTIYPTEEPSEQPTENPTFQPSQEYTFAPTSVPTGVVTSAPSSIPTTQSPSINPSPEPTFSPSQLLTEVPTVEPTKEPTAEPSEVPTVLQTPNPTVAPTDQPTLEPSGTPSTPPTHNPTSIPTDQPSVEPTSPPTDIPSLFPSTAPSTLPSKAPTYYPTESPSSAPSIPPTVLPTGAPTANPTFSPSESPTASPTIEPTTSPTVEPTETPTESPSETPTVSPMESPTVSPSIVPSNDPTCHPSAVPSISPTVAPTSVPTAVPTVAPSLIPTASPTIAPSDFPTFIPTKNPSFAPTISPTASPSFAPTISPTVSPTCGPTVLPSVGPTFVPTVSPTVQPTIAPSSGPTLSPTFSPTIAPSVAPTVAPTITPTFCPTVIPTVAPTISPTAAPTLAPTLIPTAIPTLSPTFAPSSLPPSRKPTSTSGPTPSSYFSAAPTLSPTSAVSTVPSIDKISITAYSTSVTASLTFSTTTKLAGTAYCYASLTNLTSSDVTSLLYGYGSSTTFDRGVSSVDITISNLVSVQTYSVYCSLVSSSGESSTSVTWIIAGRKSVTTACCRSISFSSNPKFMYNTSTVYLASSAGLNIFTYALSSLPTTKSTSTGLVITPALYSVAQGMKMSSSAVSFSPASTSFRSNSTSVKAAFTLWPGTDTGTNALVAGSYRVILILSGDDASSYQSTTFSSGTVSVAVAANVSLTVLASSSPPATPELASARMSDNGAAVYILFDSSTDYGGQSSTSSWTCSELLSFDGSSSSTCSWLNKTAVYVSLSSSSSITPSTSSITLLSGKIRAACVSSASATKSCSDYDTASSQNITLLAPFNGASPSVVLTTASKVSSCSDVTLDPTATTGNGGRSWTVVTWSVLFGNGTSATSVASYINTNYGSKTSSIITIPKSYLEANTYFVTLAVTNFLGKSSTVTVSFLFGADSNMPLAKIGGSSSISMKASAALELYASTEISSCSTSSKALKYSWAVYKTTTASDGTSSSSLVSSLGSQSKNPLRFYLAAYRLTAGGIYTVQFAASSESSDGGTVQSTASVSVNVYVGAIVAKIYGGSVRYITSDETLDASTSYDEDSNSTSTMQYLWSCSYASGKYYGSSCTSVLGTTSLVSSSLTVSYSNLNSSYSYSFTVKVTDAAATKSSTASVVINKMETTSGYGVAQILTSKSVFNEDATVYIDASVASNRPILAKWQAFIDGTEQVLSSELATIAKNFSSGEALSPIAYPLLLPSKSFQGGSTVAIRLSVYLWSSDAIVASYGRQRYNRRRFRRQHTMVLSGASLTFASYSEVSVRVNTAPYQGSISVSPSNGTALTTSFTATSYGWIEDSTDLPLSYDFRYAVSTSYLFFQSRSSQSSGSTKLPVGLETKGYNVTISVRAYDIYLASASVEGVVVVKTAVIADYSSVLTNLLGSATALGNTDQAISVINAVSSTMNTVDCSGVNSTYCASLNRDPCASTARTCSSCYSGYTGQIGNANTMCFSANNPPKGVDESCTSASECIYSLCSSEGKCVAPTKTCPVGGSGGLECSGNGTCEYYISGNQVAAAKCTILDTACTPSCSCDDGYGGKDCSLDAAGLQQRESARTTMCSYLTNATSASDASTTMIDSLSSSMLSAYDEYEVTTASSIDTCASSLSTILATATSSSLMDLSSSTDSAQNFVDTISEFVKPGNSSFLANITSSLVQSALSTMASGQAAISLTSGNLKLKISKSLSSELSISNQTVPLTSEEEAYGVQPMAMELSDAMSDYCDDGSGYASLSIGAFSSSPYGNATQLETSLFRSESMSSGSSRRRLQEGDDVYDDDYYGEVPAYYLTFPFTQTQSFSDGSATDDETNSNETIPACTQYANGVTVACSNCNLSYYTNVSVVFACYDPGQLCSSTSSVRRRLAIGDNVDEGKSMLYEAAALLATMGSTIGKTLSFNIFAIDLEKSKMILSFVGALFITFIGGWIIFYRWDRYDRIHFMYMQRVEKDNDKYIKMVAVNTASSRIKQEKKRKRSKIRSSSKKNKVGVSNNVTNEVTVKPKRSWHQWVSSRWTTEPTITELPNDKLNSQGGRKKREQALAIALQRQDPDIQRINELLSMIRQSMPIDVNKGFTLKGYSLYERFILPIINYHEYIVMFGRASLSKTRVIRWMNICVNVFFSLFIDTLFFSIFYEDNGFCEGFSSTSQTLCEASMNSITGDTKCTWTSTTTIDTITGKTIVDSTCYLTPPPKTILFTVFLSTITMLFAVPISMLYDYLLDEVCSKRPDLLQWEWDVFYWLGPSSQDYATWTHRVQKKEEEALKSRFISVAPPNGGVIRRNRGTQENGDEEEVPTKPIAAQYDMEDVEDEVNAMAAVSKKLLPPMSKEEELEVTHRVYVDHCTKEEEYYRIKDTMKQVYARPDVTNTKDSLLVLVNEDLTEVTAQSTSSIAMKFFGLNVWKLAQSQSAYANPSKHAETWQEWWSEQHWNLWSRYVTSSSRNALFNAIKKSRKRGEILQERFVEEASNATVDPNRLILQTFVLEQLPAYQRFALKSQCFSFPYLSPERIEPLYWFAGWFVIVGSILFYIYWVLTWALSSGNTAFRAWGVNFGVSFTQEFFLVQFSKVYLLQIATMTSCLPRLKAIQTALEEVAKDLVISMSKNGRRAKAAAADRTLIASWSAIMSVTSEKTTFALSQHISPTMRAIRADPQLKLLPACRLLMRFTDDEFLHCHSPPYGSAMGIVAAIFFGIPVIVASTLGEQFADSVFETLFPMIISGVFIAFCLLLTYVTLEIFISVVVVVGVLNLLRARIKKKILDDRRMRLLIAAASAQLEGEMVPIIRSGRDGRLRGDTSYLDRPLLSLCALPISIVHSSIVSLRSSFIHWLSTMTDFDFDLYQQRRRERLDQWLSNPTLQSTTSTYSISVYRSEPGVKLWEASNHPIHRPLHKPQVSRRYCMLIALQATELALKLDDMNPMIAGMSITHDESFKPSSPSLNDHEGGEVTEHKVVKRSRIRTGFAPNSTMSRLACSNQLFNDFYPHPQTVLSFLMRIENEESHRIQQLEQHRQDIANALQGERTSSSSDLTKTLVIRDQVVQLQTKYSERVARNMASNAISNEKRDVANDNVFSQDSPMRAKLNRAKQNLANSESVTTATSSIAAKVEAISNELQKNEPRPLNLAVEFLAHSCAVESAPQPKNGLNRYMEYIVFHTVTNSYADAFLSVLAKSFVGVGTDSVVEMTQLLKGVRKYLAAPTVSKNRIVSSCSDQIAMQPLRESSHRKSIWRPFIHVDITVDDGRWMLTRVFQLYQPHYQPLSDEAKKEVHDYYDIWVAYRRFLGNKIPLNEYLLWLEAICNLLGRTTLASMTEIELMKRGNKKSEGGKMGKITKKLQELQWDESSLSDNSMDEQHSDASSRTSPKNSPLSSPKRSRNNSPARGRPLILHDDLEDDLSASSALVFEGGDNPLYTAKRKQKKEKVVNFEKDSK